MPNSRPSSPLHTDAKEWEALLECDRVADSPDPEAFSSQIVPQSTTQESPEDSAKGQNDASEQQAPESSAADLRINTSRSGSKKQMPPPRTVHRPNATTQSRSSKSKSQENSVKDCGDHSTEYKGLTLVKTKRSAPTQVFGSATISH